MRLCRTEVLLVALAVNACAFDEGNVWGQADLGLSASFAPPAERLTEAGRLKTSAGYALRLDAVEVSFGALSAVMASDGGATVFDPANPPPSYSLCHNGHCHHESGALVDYEDIVAELAGAPTAAVSVQRQSTVALQPLSATAVPIDLGPCSGDCVLQQGVLGFVRLEVTELRLVGQVFDLQGGRLPAEGVAIDVRVPLGFTAGERIEAPIDSGQSIGVRLRASFLLPPHFLDGIEFDKPGGGPVLDGATLSDRIVQNIVEQPHLTIGVSRFDPAETR